MRRPWTSFCLAAAFAICSLLVHERTPQDRLADAAERLQRQIDQASAELEREARVALKLDSGSDSASLCQALSDHEQDGVRIFHGGQVVVWTDRAPLDDSKLDSCRGAHLDLADGTYLHASATHGDRSVHILRRIWFNPPFENQYLQRHFDAGLSLPAGIIAGASQGPIVRDSRGRAMLHLQWGSDQPPPGPRSVLSLCLALAAICCCIAAWWQVSFALRRPWAALCAFIVPLFAVRFSTLAHGTCSALVGYELFDPSLFASSFFMPSLGDLLIDAAVLLCSACFVHRVLGRLRGPQHSLPFTVLVLALLFTAAAGINAVMIALVHDSSVSLDLFRVQDFDAYSWIALFGTALLLIGWCVLADAFIVPLRPTMSTGRWLLVLAAATVAMTGIYHLSGTYDLMMALWPFPVIVLLARSKGSAWSITPLLLIATLALFTAHTLNRQTFKRIRMDRAALAENATTREDPVIELLFTEASMEMRTDPRLDSWLREDRPCTASELDHEVRRSFFTGYWDRYDVRLHLLPGTGGYCSTSPDAPASAQSIIDRFEQGVPTARNESLRITDRPGEEALYIGRIVLADASLYVELRPRLIAEGLGFPELLLAGSPAGPHRSDRFVRARYERAILTETSGPHVFPIVWRGTVPSAGKTYTDNGYDMLVQGSPQTMLLVLGVRLPTWLDHVTTFSYLFLFFSLIAALTGLVRVCLGRGPVVFGLSGKIRVGVMVFAVISLGLFTYGMRHILRTRSIERTTRTLNDRSRGVLSELRQALRGEDALRPALMPYLDELLSNFSNVFLTDLSLYSPDGLLLATSREQVFNTGLLGRRMDPAAYQRLAIDKAGSFVHHEHIGTAFFNTSYMPFRNDRGEVLAYLALPYFARQSEVEQERTAGYVALVNLFTLLFLLSVVAAALITGWTTRPLRLLRRGLEQVGLGERNTPIPYQGNDELGELVRVYNSKVEELRISAEKLARSERESAWREMARQVAHEIKNPLTPMKLNIQHFQRTWTPNLPDAKERLDRLSSGLVDQIDALSHIADEFTHFAQMPHARPVDLDLGEAARRAVALYSQQPGATVELVGDETLTVHIDPDHLLRILNNLIKNALQAIPPERDGRVRIILERADDEAIMEVRDNGEGISEEWRERIFTPNFTTKSSGMGLGLSMVQRMAEHAGGRVWFETTTGVGTSFFVALPSKKSPDTFAASDQPVS